MTSGFIQFGKPENEQKEVEELLDFTTRFVNIKGQQHLVEIWQKFASDFNATAHVNGNLHHARQYRLLSEGLAQRIAAASSPSR